MRGGGDQIDKGESRVDQERVVGDIGRADGLDLQVGVG